MKLYQQIALSAFAASILTGCSATFQEAMSKNFNEVSNDKEVVLDGKKMPDISKKYKNIQKKNYLWLNNAISLKKALADLEKIDGRRYYLDKNTEDIMLPTANVKIYTFGELKTYIEDTLEKTIFISKNAIIKRGLKIIKIQDIREKKWDLSRVDFQLNTEMSVKDALKLLSEDENFQFSLSIDNDDFGTNDPKIFKETYINFKGNTVSSFFNYLSKKLNIFIDIDYEHQVANIHKYKKQNYTLNIGNLKMSVSGNVDTQVTSDGEAQSNAISEKISIDIYTEITNKFKLLVSNSKANGNKRSYFTLDKQTGNITVYADNKTIKAFTQEVNITNDAYKDMIEVEILSFDLVFSKDYLLNTGFNVTKASSGSQTTFGLASSVTNVIGSALSFTDKALPDSTGTSIMFESLQNIGYVANKKKDAYVMRNHIPDSDSTLETERYLKNITAIGATENDAASSTTETDIIKKPEGYSITAHYSNGMISLDMRDYRGQLISLETLGTGTTAVQSPKTKSTDSVKHLILKDGESFIVRNQTNIATSQDFKGLIPTDWLGINAIGGGNDESILYTQSIKIITAKKINNL